MLFKKYGCSIGLYAHRESEKTKIRVGFLLDKISDEAETRVWTPSFEYLDRSKFEIIVYHFQEQDERLGNIAEIALTNWYNCQKICQSSPRNSIARFIFC